MRIRRFLIALLVVLGIVLSPSLAAAMIPALFVYDGAAPPATTVPIDVERSLRPECGVASEYAYDAVHVDQGTSELVERPTYQPFAQVESDYRPARWGAFREVMRHSGHEDDARVGLIYFGARYYAPQLTQWVSPDPLAIHGLGGDLNPYAFVRGGPVSKVDAFGLEDGAPGSEQAATGQSMQQLGAYYAQQAPYDPESDAPTASDFDPPKAPADCPGCPATPEELPEATSGPGDFDFAAHDAAANVVAAAWDTTIDISSSLYSLNDIRIQLFGGDYAAFLNRSADIDLMKIGPGNPGGVTAGRAGSVAYVTTSIGLSVVIALSGNEAAAAEEGTTAFRAFNAGNFRANLARLTGGIEEGAQAHHVFPQKFADAFARLGVDIHNPAYGAWWNAAEHASNSGAYNAAWADFFAAGDRTAAEAMQFGRDLASQYGFTIHF
jgi:RHS repeat-associated protein